MPYRRQDFGLTALEALSLNRPIIISSNSGVSEIIARVCKDQHIRSDYCLIAEDSDVKRLSRRFSKAIMEIIETKGITSYYNMLAAHMVELCSWEAGANTLINNIEELSKILELKRQISKIKAPAKEEITSDFSGHEIMLKGFVSYSHQDDNIRLLLLRHLRALEQDGVLRLWTDAQLRCGDDWESRISGELCKADVAVVLVTPSIMEPGCFIQKKELPRCGCCTGAGQLHVMPVIGKKVMLENAFLSRLEAVPGKGTPIDKYKTKDHWAMQVATDLNNALHSIRNHSGRKHDPEVQLAMNVCISKLDKLSRSFDRRAKHAHVFAASALIESIRSAIRAPRQDLWQDVDCVTATIKVELPRIGAGSFEWDRNVSELIASLHNLIEVLHLCKYPSSDLSSAATRAKSAILLVRIEELRRIWEKLVEEANFLRQHRRTDGSHSKRNACLDGAADWAEDKANIAMGLAVAREADEEGINRAGVDVLAAGQGLSGVVYASPSLFDPAVVAAADKFTAATAKFERATSAFGTRRMLGTVKSFDSSSGHWTIIPDRGGKDVLVHVSVVESAGMRHLVNGTRIEFELATDDGDHVVLKVMPTQ